MKKSMILELATSDNNYFEDINMVGNGEYKKCLEEVHAMLEQFCEGMTEKEKYEIMWKFEAAQGGPEEMTAEEYFKRGFKLGLILGAQNFLE